MNYQIYQPHADLEALVKCYWTLEIPAQDHSGRQRIVPDGCIELAFILGDDIKRYTSGNEFILQPRAMVLGQTIDPFYIEPTGYVRTFAVRFYPYGFANFINTSIKNLANKETPVECLFEKYQAKELEQEMVQANSVEEQIAIIEAFLLHQLNQKSTIDKIVKSTMDALLDSKGSMMIKTILQDNISQRRKMERKFSSQVGVSPKQLGKVIRFQTALKMMLNNPDEPLTKIAYESDYYDQAHFVKDFKEFTGVNPKDFIEDNSMNLSSLFYTKD